MFFTEVQPPYIFKGGLTGFEPVTFSFEGKSSNHVTVNSVQPKMNPRKIVAAISLAGMRLDLNQLPTEYKSVALPNELHVSRYSVRGNVKDPKSEFS